MNLGIADKVALVAGSSRGIGRAIADELAAEGVHLVICARGHDALQQAEESLRRHGGEVVAVRADLTDPAGVARVVDAGRQVLGPIDILVTNTGGPPPGPFDAHADADWEHAVRQNLFSVLRLVRAVLPDMKSRRHGRIVNVTSVAVRQPIDNLILSNTVRAAVTGFARTLANEVADYGITVNNVLPGYTRTERLERLAADAAATRGITREDVLAGWEAQIPMGRLGDARELAALVAFLVSERAAYVTGTSIPVDGGWVRSLM